MINSRNHFLRRLHRGDTLIEVMFAVGIFGLVAIGAVGVMNRGLYTAQGTLETTMARNEMDTQAEALRFIHDAYASKKKSASNTYSELWNLIRDNFLYRATEADDMSTLNYYLTAYDLVAKGGGEIDGEPYETCADLYNAIPSKSFVINPSILDEKTLAEAIDNHTLQNIILSNSDIASSTKFLTETPTFPRLFYSNTDDGVLSDATGLDGATTGMPALQEAQGIWVTAVSSEKTSDVDCGDAEPDYYDFYIRTCWDTPGSNHPRTISTNVRLYNSDQITLNQNYQITFDNIEWIRYGDRVYSGHLSPCSSGRDPNPKKSGSSNVYTVECEPIAGQHVTFPDATSIRLLGSTSASTNLGAYYDKFDAYGKFDLSVHVDATNVSAHPGGSLTISFTYVDESGKPLATDSGIRTTMNDSIQSVQILGGDSLDITSTDFDMRLTHDRGTFTACITDSSATEKCISADKEVPSGAYLKVDYNLTHGSHSCNRNAYIMLSDIYMSQVGGSASSTVTSGKCTEEKYTVWYHKNDGTGSIHTETATVGKDITISENTFINDGYSFVSWNTKEDGSGTTYIPGDTAHPSIKKGGAYHLYAIWDANGYELSYDPNGGTGHMAKQTSRAENALTLRNNLFSREDYQFDGWADSLDLTNPSLHTYSDGDTVPANTYLPTQQVTLYAQWKPVEYTVSYDLNGGTGTIPAPQKVDSGSSIKLIDSDGLSREGYHFVGWALGSPSGEAYSAGNSYTVKSSVTFYARWAPNTYMIKFVGQGGATNDGKTITTQEFQSGVAEKLDTNPFIRDGYEFAGWSLEESSTEVAYSDGESITRSEKRDSIVTLYAVWRAEYTVSYNLNGGTGTVPASKVVAHGDTIQIASGAGLSKNYNHFGGWLLGAKGYSALANYIVTSDVTFYANWIPDAYAVQLNGNGGQTKEGQIIDAQMGFQSNVPKALKKNPFKRAGYEFIGWGLSSTDTTKTYSDQETITRVEKEGTIVQLYAIWAIAPKTYRLSYDANGGSGAPSMQSATNTASSATFTVSSTVPTKSDHIFQGWSTSADAKSVTHKSGDNITITKDTTLYAVWEKKPTPVSYTVTYDSNGGTGTLPATSSYSAGTSITLSSGSGLTRQYYHLVGWTLGSASGTSYSKGASYTVNSNVTFYAKWERDNYQVTYKRNCGSSDTTNEVKNHNVGSAFSVISKPSAWSCSGKDFSGWATSASGSASSAYAPGKSFTPTSAGSLTLYAVWTTPVTYTTYTLKYDANGGSGAPSDDTDTTTNDHGTFVISSVIPTRSDYTFRGWSDNKNATDPEVVGGNTKTTKAAVVTIYAVWKKNTTTTPPSSPSTGCGSGWAEWTSGLCWQTSDAAKYVNHTDAGNTCSSKGYRLPTMSEYNQLIQKYCSERYLRGTWYCDASSPLAQNFNFNGLIIVSATLSGTHGFYWMSNKEDIFAVIKNNDSEGLTSATTHGENLFGGGSVSIVRASVRCVRNK